MWLDNLIYEGIQRLLILRLKDAPALDTIELLADTWIQVFKSRTIAWDEPLDTPRIRQAFLICAGKLESWPAPKAVLENLPPRPELLKISHEKTSTMPENFKAMLAEEMAKSTGLSDEQRLARKAQAMEDLRRLTNP
jgi:hypothetical protein